MNYSGFVSSVISGKTIYPLLGDIYFDQGQPDREFLIRSMKPRRENTVSTHSFPPFREICLEEGSHVTTTSFPDSIYFDKLMMAKMMMMMTLFLLSCGGGGGVLAEQKKKEVTVELFGRAESDVTFASYLGGVAFNEFGHLRALTPLDEQKVVRMNRDTLYSFVVLDFGKCTPSGVKLLFPPAENIGDRFVSAEIISQDHDIIATKYLKDDVDGSGIEITPSDVGTDKALILLRTFTDGTDDDLTKAHAVQDLFSVVPINGEEGDESSCQASKEEYMAEVAMWDKDSLATVRDLIKELQKHSNATSGEMFGPNRDELNYLYYLFGTATGWGGQPSEDAVYIYGKSTSNHQKEKRKQSLTT